MGRPKREAGHNTKEEIIARAAKLFASKGYSATSISMIAREVGIGKSAIYSHFRSKEEIIAVIIDRYGPAGVMKVIKGIDFENMERNPEEEFTGLIKQFVDFFALENSRLFTDLVRMGCVSFVSAGPNSFQETIAQARKLAEGLVKRLQEMDIIEKDYSANFIAWELIAPIVHARFMFFSSTSSEEDIKAGKDICFTHIKYFIRNNFVRSK